MNTRMRLCVYIAIHLFIGERTRGVLKNDTHFMLNIFWSYDWSPTGWNDYMEIVVCDVRFFISFATVLLLFIALLSSTRIIEPVASMCALLVSDDWLHATSLMQSVVSVREQCKSQKYIYIYIFILTANGFSPGGNGTTLRHYPQTTHITQNNTTIKRNTVHKNTHTMNTLHRMKIQL
jgi:hypothetical protein